MKNMVSLLILFCFISTFASFGCSSNQPIYQSVSNVNELDLAVRDAAHYLNNGIQNGRKLVILNFESDHTNLSEYVIDELISYMVDDRIFTVVDRVNLELIRQETNFQMSGEVSDETAVSIGKKLGAQTIVSGAISQVGNIFRLRVRALDVETAQIQGQFNRNIPAGGIVAMFINRDNSAILASVTQQPQTGRPGTVAITVAEAQNLRNNTPVILQGRIERFLGDEKYLFSDGSGSIVVEINDDVWDNLSLSQNDMVEIIGEIDRKSRGNEVEVEIIRKL